MSEINWSDFTDKHGHFARYGMGEPRVIGGVKYATNSRVAIAFPSDEPDTVSNSKFPSVESVLSEMGLVEQWHPLDVQLADCSVCNNTGRQRCPKCDGYGERECDMGHCHSCEECDDDNCIQCEECQKISNSTRLLGINITRNYMRDISKLPAPILYGVSDANASALLFRFGEGGRGAVASMREDCE